MVENCIWRIGRSRSLNVIQSVAQKHQASLSASAWRYCYIAARPYAVIWSTNKIVQRARRSDSFRLFLRRRIKVPQGSYAMAAHEGKDVPGDTEPDAADEWIDNWNLREASGVTLKPANGGQGKTGQRK